MRALIATILVMTLAGCVTTGTSEDKTKMAEGLYTRGLSYLEVKEYEKAIVEFQKSVKSDSQYKMSYYALGLVHDMMGKPADAEAFYKQTLSIDSDFPDAHNALGVIYLQLHRDKEALKEFQRALTNKTYSTPHVAYLNMGDLYFSQKDYIKAAEAYKDSKRLVTQDFTIHKLGMALLDAGNVKEAIKELQEGVALSPKNSDMRLALGMAFLKDGNKGAAVAEFKTVIKLAPKSDAARVAQDYVTTLR